MVHRTLIDLCHVATKDAVHAALLDALRRGLTSVPRITRAMEGTGTRGRTRMAQLRELLDSLGSGPPPESVLEARVLRILRAAGLPRPALQHRVRARGRVVARVDFAYPRARVAIEADGFRFHGSRPDWQRDLGRRNTLTTMGWRVVHVTWADLEDPERWVRALTALLGRPGQTALG